MQVLIKGVVQLMRYANIRGSLEFIASKFLLINIGSSDEMSALYAAAK